MQYSSPSCAGSPAHTGSLSVGESVNLFNPALYFMVNELVCSSSTTADGSNCAVDITFSSDCSGTHSATYTNFAVPPNQCETLAGDFGYGQASWLRALSSIPYAMFPETATTALFETALKFKCCQSDGSLLIYNYSQTTCDEPGSFDVLRLADSYNGQCFVLGADQLPFTGTNQAATASVDTDDGVFALRYAWNCDQAEGEEVVADCSDIPMMEEALLPNVCPDQCLEAGYAVSSTSTSTTPAPTTVVTVSTVHSRSTASTQHAQPYNGQSDDSQPLSGTTRYVLIGVVALLVVACVVVTGLGVFHKRKMRRIVEQNKQKQDRVDDPKYEPMMSGQQQLDHIVGVSDKHGDDEDVDAHDVHTAEGEYVLPGTQTSGAQRDGDDENLL
eukprot:CAMPEP_0197022542 /NCGR_PEP_ID=MMETSP1384-20130603/3382_1 /TAXON_ID=29189 /ORGANISM="Ammonia sp." /LENGTH=386 /DNA_ID=CAMNT_0042450601 /DNA_START=264 /DNA_END=1424 /DNA_ORIENTATION=-